MLCWQLVLVVLVQAVLRTTMAAQPKGCSLTGPEVHVCQIVLAAATNADAVVALQPQAVQLQDMAAVPLSPSRAS